MSKDVIQDSILQDPEAMYAAGLGAQRINDGTYQRWMVDIVFQVWGGPGSSKYEVSNAWAAAQVITSWVLGEFLMIGFYVGREPPRDKDLPGLQLSSPGPIEYDVRGGDTAPDDGAVHITGPLLMACGNPDVSEYTEVDMAGRQFPLEVGYTCGATTWMHIKGRGGLARWPYGSEFVYLIVDHARRTGSDEDPIVWPEPRQRPVP